MGCFGSKPSPVVSNSTDPNAVIGKFQVKLFGPPGVGKTSFILKAMNEPFSESPHLSPNQLSQTIPVKIKQGIVQLVITDTGGSEQFRKATTSEYYGAQVVLHIFALNDPNSFKEVLNFLADSVRFTNDVPLFVIGNKQDLPRDKLTKEKIEAEIKEKNPSHEVTYYETSCKSGNTVLETLEEIATFLVE